MVPQHDERVLNAARAIKRYLESHPNAADSSEGVLKWWLARQRYDESVEIVRQALEWLVAEGEVEKSEIFGGGPVYSSASKGPRQDRLH